MKHAWLMILFVTSAHAESRTAVTWGEHEPRERKAVVRLGAIEDGVVDHASLTLTTDASNMHAELTLRLSTKHEEPTDLHMPLLLPNGTQLTDLQLAIGTHEIIPAEMLAASTALERYEQIVADAQDPALLRWVATEEHRARYELRAFPITRTTPASVTIKMLLPRHTSVVFDPGPHRLARLDVTVDATSKRFTNVTLPRTFAITAPARETWMTADTAERVFVDHERSLFVGFDLPVRPRVHHRDQAPLPSVKLSARTRPMRDVTQQLRDRKHALAHCYAFGRELEPTLLPFVDLAITIDTAGVVKDVLVSGDMDHGVVRACIADEVRGWQFGTDERTRVVKTSIDLRSGS